MPSIAELHNFEIKREINKAKGCSPLHPAEVEDDIFQYQIQFLSVLSYHILEQSLSSSLESKQEFSICNQKLLLSLEIVYLKLKDTINFDQKTRKRIENFNTKIVDDRHKGSNIFIRLVDSLLNFSDKFYPTYLSVDEKQIFLFVVASVLEQSYYYRLISLNISSLGFYGFLNQRAGDYLAAHYLAENGLENILNQGQINFWLFRAIAIAQSPNNILNPKFISNDLVFATAVVNGLALVRSDRKSNLGNFIELFVECLLDENIFASDPCAPLRVLGSINRLSSNGYSEYFQLPRKLFSDLLKNNDSSISDAAAITILTYSSRKQFKFYFFVMLIKYFLLKAFRLEFNRKLFNSFFDSINRGIIGNE